MNIFLYSIAGKKTNDFINELCDTLVNDVSTPKADVRILKYVLKVADNGNYPNPDYFKAFYAPAEFTYSSRAELKTYVDSLRERNKSQYLQSQVLQTINESENAKDLSERLSSLIDSQPDDSEDIDFSPITISSRLEGVIVEGLKSGIQELDEVTNGFQHGNIATILAFTGHGKSTCLNSIIYSNIMHGKKGILFSLELAPELVWGQFEARYMNQELGIQITASDITQNRISEEDLKRVKENEDKFLNSFDGLAILDESYLSKAVLFDYKNLSKLVTKVANKLGGCDFVAFDHVGQFELLFPDRGNEALKNIQSFTKTFQDCNGVRPVTFWAVQANRDGEARARKRKDALRGSYDIQAIGDLNEVERSSSYIFSLFTDDEGKIRNETRIGLIKHRFGSVISEPFITQFNPALLMVGSGVDEVTVSDDSFADAFLSDDSSSDGGGFSDIDFGSVSDADW